MPSMPTTSRMKNRESAFLEGLAEDHQQDHGHDALERPVGLHVAQALGERDVFASPGGRLANEAQNQGNADRQHHHDRPRQRLEHRPGGALAGVLDREGHGGASSSPASTKTSRAAVTRERW